MINHEVEMHDIQYIGLIYYRLNNENFILFIYLSKLEIIADKTSDKHSLVVYICACPYQRDVFTSELKTASPVWTFFLHFLRATVGLQFAPNVQRF